MNIHKRRIFDRLRFGGLNFACVLMIATFLPIALILTVADVIGNTSIPRLYIALLWLLVLIIYTLWLWSEYPLGTLQEEWRMW